MRLGYACINTDLGGFSTCRLETYRAGDNGLIKNITLDNLEKTRNIIDWNLFRGIKFYRLSSNLIPFASHDEMTFRWWEDKDILYVLEDIRWLKNKYGVRLSMHPPQFTALSTDKSEVLRKSLLDLEWHGRLMDLIDGDDLILHAGGAYGDIESASRRFANEYKNLPDNIRKRIRLENDDKTYALVDVLDIHEMCGVPICFDIHHHNCNNYGGEIDYEDVYKTWEGFGTPKVHISSGKEHKTDTKHHDFVSTEDFDELMRVLNGRDVDIMFETKMKEQSTLKFLERV